MSDAIYFATRDFANTYHQAANTHYNPLRALRKGSENLCAMAQNDAPTQAIFRRSIPGHLFQVTCAGTRLGAKAGAQVADALRGSMASIKHTLVGHAQRREHPQVIKQKNTWCENASCVAGTLSGSLVGITLKSIEHLSVTGLYLGAAFMGASVGTLIGLPVAAMYALHVLGSSDKRSALRARRASENAAAIAGLCPDAQTSAPNKIDKFASVTKETSRTGKSVNNRASRQTSRARYGDLSLIGA